MTKTTKQLVTEMHATIAEHKAKLKSLEEQLLNERPLFPSPNDPSTEVVVAPLRARAYCLEAINKANKGDNGFKKDVISYTCSYDHQDYCLTVCHGTWLQHVSAEEYIRTEEAAKALVVDEDFVTNWKIWKQV